MDNLDISPIPKAISWSKLIPKVYCYTLDTNSFKFPFGIFNFVNSMKNQLPRGIIRSLVLLHVKCFEVSEGSGAAED